MAIQGPEYDQVVARPTPFPQKRAGIPVDYVHPVGLVWTFRVIGFADLYNARVDLDRIHRLHFVSQRRGHVITSSRSQHRDSLEAVSEYTIGNVIVVQ